MAISPDELRKQWSSAADEKEVEDLPPITTLSIDVVGSRGKRYQGSFVFKVPTIGEQIDIGRLKSAYLPQGSAADPNAALLVEQCCFLEVTIQKKNMPAWFRPFELYDASPVSALYAEAIKYERRFHRTDKNAAADLESNSEAENKRGSDPAGVVALGEDIPATAQRSKVLISESARGD